MRLLFFFPSNRSPRVCSNVVLAFNKFIQLFFCFLFLLSFTDYTHGASFAILDIIITVRLYNISTDLQCSVLIYTLRVYNKIFIITGRLRRVTAVDQNVNNYNKLVIYLLYILFYYFIFFFHRYYLVCTCKKKNNRHEGESYSPTRVKATPPLLFTGCPIRDHGNVNQSCSERRSPPDVFSSVENWCLLRFNNTSGYRL